MLSIGLKDFPEDRIVVFLDDSYRKKLISNARKVVKGAVKPRKSK